MRDRVKLRRAKSKKPDVGTSPKRILDIIEAHYGDRYFMIQKDYNRIVNLFSGEEWIDILTKSRSSHESYIK